MSSPAGSRVHAVSATSVGCLAVFVAGVLAIVAADLAYAHPAALLDALRSPELRHAIRLSLLTSAATLLIVIAFAVPVGYALSRYRFPGSAVLDAIVDLPIVLPPVVAGVSLLIFFRTPLGRFIESVPGLQFVYTVKGIILCQCFLSASLGIRTAKSAFDAVDPRLEGLALTLGCTRGQAFRLVALPLARRGLVAAAILAWARAIGIFGPLIVFVGAVRMKTEVMPTTVYLELSVGRIEPALAVALILLAIALAALTFLHALGGLRGWGDR